MKEDFTIHNLFWKSPEEFLRYDPHLSKLSELSLIYHSPLIKEISDAGHGIYILTGGRQVGKSTLLKLLIKKILNERKLQPKHIYYLPCDTILDFKGLLFEIEQFCNPKNNSEPFMLILDEISYVTEWERGIKSLADSGLFTQGMVIITGSDTYLLKKAMMAFPGRRGKADKHDFHLHPLSFHEYVELKDSTLHSALQDTREEFHENCTITRNREEHAYGKLQKLFNEYLLCGGYLRAINDYAKDKSIHSATYNTYLQWIIGDILKRGKSENYLHEIIKTLIPRIASQITWNDFASKLSIEHHQTVIDYIDILTRMDIVVVLQALIENKLEGAPKKAKKVHFFDPFIFHSLHGWVMSTKEPYTLSDKVLKSNSHVHNALIEGIVASLFHRNNKIFYIKAEKEVDIVLIKNNAFFPIEIKNSLSIDKKEIKQILKYKKGIVGYEGTTINTLDTITLMPIPLLAYCA